MRLAVAVLLFLVAVGYAAATAYPYPPRNKTVAAALKHRATKPVDAVKCPDGTQCADGQTCCKLNSGEYGCCPYPNATCCSDGASCCPAGYTCNLETGACENPATSESLPMLQKLPTRAEYVYCIDGSYCPSGDTCCYDYYFGDYGCCPYSDASCCVDGIHCCPSNTYCYNGSCYSY